MCESTPDIASLLVGGLAIINDNDREMNEKEKRNLRKEKTKIASSLSLYAVEKQK